MLSYTGNSAAESYWWWRYRGNGAAARYICWVMPATVLLSHAGNGATKATWPRHDVDAESYWQQCYWGNLATTRCRCRVMLVTMLPRHADDSATTRGCTGYGKVAQPPSSEHRGVIATWRSCAIMSIHFTYIIFMYGPNVLLYSMLLRGFV
jgi:hypothetical protein